MPVYSIEKIDGMRRTPQRVFPPNGLKHAKNILTSVENNIFQTASPIETLMILTDSGSPEIKHAIKNYFEGSERVFFIYEIGTNLYFCFFDGSVTTIKDLYDASYSTYNWRLLTVGSSIIVHPFYVTSEVNLGRKYYKSMKYTRNNVEYDETDLFDMQKVPSVSTDLVPDIDVIDSSTIAESTSDTPIILSGSPTGRYYVMLGYQLNGFESIAFENAEFHHDVAVENMCLRISVKINSSKISKLVSGVDIYLGHGKKAGATDFVQNPVKDLENWMFVDYIPMDLEEKEVVASTAISTIVGPYVTVTGKTWANNQWKHFVAKIGGVYHLISSNTSNILTCSGAPSGSTVEIYSRWHKIGGYYYVAKYLTADEGESIVDKCGVSHLKIKSSYDYCPVANYVEYFKGFVWMADYVDRDNERRRNRLITNIINSEGLSCYSVYNTDIYIEFKSDILGLKAYDDYMLVFTGDGIYTVRFTPGQDISSYAWTAKKISDLKIPTKEYVTGYGNISFLFDNYRLYTSDGYDVKLITNDEINLIIADYTNSTDITANSYSISYCEQDSNIYLCLDEVISFKGGIIVRDAVVYDTGIGRLIGTYNGEPVYFFDEYIKIIRLMSNKHAATFDVQFHNTDLKTKEDKYFVQSTIKILKANIGDVYIQLYLDNTLMKEIQLNHMTSYWQYFDIRLPKSSTRRFSKMYFRIYGSSTSTSGINFQLESLDIEVEPIRRTVLS